MPTSAPTHSKNRPTLVAYDLRTHVQEGLVYDSLYRRGVFKAFFIREQLWKFLDMLLAIGNDGPRTGTKHHSAEYWRGYRQCALDDRADLKRLLQMPKSNCLPGDKELDTYIQKKLRGE